MLSDLDEQYMEITMGLLGDLHEWGGGSSLSSSDSAISRKKSSHFLLIRLDSLKTSLHTSIDMFRRGL